MEKRRSARINIRGGVNCRMVLVEHLELIDLSLTGVRFTCFGRVDMKGPRRIKIEKGKVCVNLRGKVVRSTLKTMGNRAGRSVPVYEVAMQFDSVPDSEAQILAELIRLLVHG